MMNKNFIGNQIIGNFKISENISQNENLLLEKNNDFLYIVSDAESILLEPLDINADNIVQIFSDKPKDDNESIYKISVENDIATVLLCTYLSVEYLDSTGVTIYVSRIDESDYSIRLKCDINHLFDQLKEEFVYNSSVFFEQNEKNTSKPKMIGIDYNAELEQERPGVFRITKLTKNTRKNFNYLFQIYGNINFLKWDKAILVKSNEVIKLEDIKNNQIFKAWETYIDYLKAKTDTELVKNGYCVYKSFRYDGDQIEITLEQHINILDTELFKDYKNKEYGCIVKNETLPANMEEFIRYKNENYKKFVHLGNIRKIGNHNNIYFDIPNNTDKLGEEDFEGILCISDKSFNIEYRRRRGILDTINSKKNKTANALMRLMEDNVIDTQKGSNTHPITNNVLLKMFNRNDIELKENYRKAMDIAINTPDIAVIQGPPGTGKTTLIAGVLARINEMSHKSYKVLISSEQHEALKNAVGKVSGNFVPPLITSVERYKDDNHIDQKMIIVEQFKQKLEHIANGAIGNRSTMSYSKYLAKYISLVQKISHNNYNNWIIEENYDDLVSSIKYMGLYDLLIEKIIQLRQNIRIDSQLVKEIDPSKLLLKRKIEAQRITIEAFKDDGIYQLESLQKMLELMELKDYKIPNHVFDELIVNKDDYDTSIFEAYINYVKDLKKVFTEVDKNPFIEGRVSSKDIIEEISKIIEHNSLNRDKNIEDIFEEFIYRLQDIDNVTEIIRNYSCVIGSTAAQANKSILVADTDIYDYVIIDEASRANPLDIMIPMVLGIKIILIGDQKQLPHYIENHTIRDFNSNQNILKEYEERHLTTSLFEVIYNNLENAYKEDRIAYQRHIRINEQHRMHPDIGTFISNEFYEGSLVNGDNTLKKINDYKMFNGKNIAVIDIPYTEGPEEKINDSYFRSSEVNAILNILKRFLKQNEAEKLEIGIIAYYKNQVDLINNMIVQNFPSKIMNNIRCGTVDSYQGREFDIVIISGTRSNLKPDPMSSLGFIHKLPSRVNVSLSRAKKLLIFVGDCSTFEKTEHFKHFFEYARQIGFYETFKIEKEEEYG